MNSTPIKRRVNHYVPKFYLNEFADPNDKSKEPRFWCYDTENQTLRKIATSKVAKIKNYYRLYDNGVIHDALDDALCHFESEAAPIFRRLRDETLEFNDVHLRYQFGRFVCFLLVRTPQFQQHTRLHFQNQAKSRLIEHLSKDNNLEKAVAELNKKGSGGFTEREFIEGFNKLKINLHPGPFQLVLLKSAQRMILHFL
ncbi:MAG: DUF4238 domain-containing protein [Bacteroidetes bacterium]|nr:DUF4238 domain-containing protein [Bacteroidota bacterium]MCL5737863.1 DUF4238 domain-containing protein [Bacteroidota bacterium]